LVGPGACGFSRRVWESGGESRGCEGGGEHEGEDCPLQETVQTEWPLESQLLVRRVIEIPEGATKIRIMVSVDNDIIGLFFNGIVIAENIRHGECPILDEFRFDVPQELVRPGPNLVAFHVLDRPPEIGPANESFFDTRILAELPLESQEPAPQVVEVPLVPVSNINSHLSPTTRS
jgi:hypothetical protein